MKKIPLSRLLIYLFILMLLPSLLAGAYFTRKYREWELLKEEIQKITLLSENYYRKQALNLAVQTAFKEADSLYLEKKVESLCFLNHEKQALNRILENPSFTGNEEVEKRYAFLEGSGNRLSFSQESIQNLEGIQESVEKANHSIEIDTADLKELLNRIEGDHPYKPQLIISDLKLSRKVKPEGGEVFDFDLKLIKREFQK